MTDKIITSVCLILMIAATTLAIYLWCLVIGSAAVAWMIGN